MSKTETLLSTLRDIHEPAAPESVSLWLIGANLFLLVILASLFYLSRRRLSEGWRRQARREIKRAKNADAQKGIVLLAQLLRKIAIHRKSSRHHDHGESWLTELDTLFHTQWFTQGEGRIFGSALYQKTSLTQHELSVAGDNILRLVNALPTVKDTPVKQA